MYAAGISFKVSSRVKNHHFSKLGFFRWLNRAHQELSFKKNSRKKCFFCADLRSAKVFSMLITLIDRWQVLSYLIRVPLLNQANHAIWQKSWFTSIVLTVFPWSLGFYYNQEKWLKDDKAPEKPIETTAESSFTSVLASGASFLGREAAKWETKSWEVPRYVNIGRSTVLKVYCSRKEASRKTPGSGLFLICTGKCRTFKKINVSSKSELGSTWLVRYENENCPLQITNDAFLTTERIEQSRAFEINC